MLRIFFKISLRAYIYIKRKIYNYASDIPIPNKNVKIYQPQLRTGKGKIKCANDVQFGIPERKGYFESITYLNLRNSSSRLIIESNVSINNNFYVTSAGGTIRIGKRTLIGNNVSIFDSDFHSINPNQRLSSNFSIKDVIIGENVWIGNDCKILKGVTIGNNSIISINSVVKNNIPENCIAAGNPAKVISKINF